MITCYLLIKKEVICKHTLLKQRNFQLRDLYQKIGKRIRTKIENCRRDMIQRHRSRRETWLCSKYDCQKEVGLYRETFFEGMHLNLKKFFFYKCQYVRDFGAQFAAFGCQAHFIWQKCWWPRDLSFPPSKFFLKQQYLKKKCCKFI